MAEELTISFDEFPIMRALRQPSRARDVFEQEYRRAGRRVGKVLEGRMREVIQSGHMPANAGLTADLKGSSKPLVGPGPGARLFKAITSEVRGSLDDMTISVGVMRTHEEANVARIVHEGTRPFTVTPRMAALFRAIAAFTAGRAVTLRSERAQQIAEYARKPIAPLRVGSRLVIPPRPFAKVVLEASSTRDLVLDEYRAAMLRALNRLSS